MKSKLLFKKFYQPRWIEIKLSINVNKTQYSNNIYFK